MTSVTTAKLQEEVTSNVVRFTLLMFRRLHSDERGRGGVNCRLARLGLFKRVGTRSAVGQAGRPAGETRDENEMKRMASSYIICRPGQAGVLPNKTRKSLRPFHQSPFASTAMADLAVGRTPRVSTFFRRTLQPASPLRLSVCLCGGASERSHEKSVKR